MFTKQLTGRSIDAALWCTKVCYFPFLSGWSGKKIAYFSETLRDTAGFLNQSSCPRACFLRWITQLQEVCFHTKQRSSGKKIKNGGKKRGKLV